jgi:hypothetical protein
MRYGTVVGQRSGSRVALVAACSILVSVTAGGCVLGNDNDGPVLAVDPLWDVSPTETFRGRTCGDAGVFSMTWAIQDSRGDTIKESEKIEDCEPLDFLGLLPGTYRLLLTGYDRNDTERWQSTCTGLELSRFDVLYTCEVDQVEPEDDEPNDENEDAGVPDAG